MIPTKVITASGHMFDLANPRWYPAILEDIAIALSNTARFGGHTDVIHTVAQHSVTVHDLLEERGHSDTVCLAGLLHDAHEAFYCDLPTPLKQMIGPEYHMAVTQFDYRICKYMGLPDHAFHHPEVIDADSSVLQWEGFFLFGSPWTDPGDLGLPYTFHQSTPDESRYSFLNRLERYV